jgi:tetratricopeptide (TPR) repeat protein
LQTPTPENFLSIRQILIQVINQPDGRSADTMAVVKAWYGRMVASDYLNVWNNTGATDLADAEQKIQDSFAISTTVSETYYADGFVKRANGDHPGALQDFMSAVGLDPTCGPTYGQAADEKVLTGDAQDAPALALNAIELDPGPRNIARYFWVLGRAHFFMNNYPLAIDWLAKSVAARDNLWYTWLYLVSAYALDGDQTDATNELTQFSSKFPGYTVSKVIANEGANPDDDPSVVQARQTFHEGLILAGMAVQ